MIHSSTDLYNNIKWSYYLSLPTAPHPSPAPCMVDSIWIIPLLLENFKNFKCTRPGTSGRIWRWCSGNFLSRITVFFKLFIYLFLETGREGERGRETSMCGCLLHTPYWGPGLQPRRVPWLGIKLATLWFTGQHSIRWATPARAVYV